SLQDGGDGRGTESREVMYTHTQRSGYKVNYDTGSNPPHAAPPAQSRQRQITLTSLIHPHAVTGAHHQVPSLPLEAPSYCLTNKMKTIIAPGDINSPS